MKAFYFISQNINHWQQKWHYSSHNAFYQLFLHLSRRIYIKNNLSFSQNCFRIIWFDSKSKQQAKIKTKALKTAKFSPTTKIKVIIITIDIKLTFINYFIIYKSITIIITLLMGNECPECQTPSTDCKMRDVFKEQPRNRDDLDLSHIKKGQFKSKMKKSLNFQESQVKLHSMPIEESIVLQKSHKKIENGKIVEKKPNPKKQQLKMIESVVEEIRPLSLDTQIQTIQIKKGLKYVGGTVDRQPQDKGKVSWEDGTTLIAQFLLGSLAQNQKIILKTQSGVEYEGEISGGKANSKGRLVLPDGSSYDGQWKQDIPHGFGKHKMTDGSYYEGNFVRGQKSGKGKFYFEDGMYEGSFLGDRFHGDGIMIMNDGRTIRAGWKNGLLEGKGQIQWKTGEKYQGTFQKGQRDGQGTYQFADGRKWTGQWKNDKQNGFGCYQLDNGETVKGIWVNGVKTDEMREMGD